MKKNISVGLLLMLGSIFNICRAENESTVLEDLVEDQNNSIAVQTIEKDKFKVKGSVGGETLFVMCDDEEDSIYKGYTFHNFCAKLGVKKSFLVYDSNVKCIIEAKLVPSKVELSKAYGEMDYLVMGYTKSNFFYKKSNDDLPITAFASAFQLKWKDKVGDHFDYGFALERGPDFEIGKIEQGKKKKEASSVYKDDDKDVTFKSENDIPIGSISMGGEWKRFDFFLSGLFRVLSYYYKNNKQETREYMPTWGGNGGITFQFIPDKTKLTCQGFYSHGIGQYITGLVSLEEDKKTPQAVAVYHADSFKNKKELKPIQTWGAGVTFTQSLTPKCDACIGGSFFTIINEEKEQHDKDFRKNALVMFGVSYKFNDHLEVGCKGSLERKFAVEEDKYSKNDLKGGIGMQFSF